MIEAGFWFLSGFVVASWLAWRVQKRNHARILQSFQVAKGEILRLSERANEITEIKITIIDCDGELEVETEEDPPAATSSRRRRGLH